MFHILRVFFLAVVFHVMWGNVAYAVSASTATSAATSTATSTASSAVASATASATSVVTSISVPVIGGDFMHNSSLSGSFSIPGVTGAGTRETCDPDIMNMLENQAWEAAEREISQNENIYPRPDSVLSVSCFDEWLNHQAWYASKYFPGDPDESEGLLLNGLMTDIFVVLPDDLISSADPNLTKGYVQYAILEILVLDQLMDVGSATGKATDAIALAFCSGKKERYIEDSFPELMIGDRAKTQSAVPAYSAISAQLAKSVSEKVYNCKKMNEVWTRTKCYDFATESEVYKSNHAGEEHDGFYTYKEYSDNAVAGKDYRKEADECDPPDSDLIKIPSASELACYVNAHGITPIPVAATSFSSFTMTGGSSYAGGGLEWDDAYDDANPDAGDPGAGDAYGDYYDMVSGSATSCHAPLRTGYIVTTDKVQYYDAVCPNIGCYFTPPSSLSGTGTCSK